VNGGANTEEIEARIRAACDAADLQRAATLLLESYGGEIFRFVASRLRDVELASEVFSEFAEDLWRGLRGFRWVCSARAWAYTLARHAASRALRQRRRRGIHYVSLSHAGPLSEVAAHVRSETSLALRTEPKDRLAELRHRLADEDQALLVLRVNRGLPWLDIARIMKAGSVEAAMAITPDELNAEASRLRKRFQKAKEKLRRLAEEAGLLAD
jgi:RNA polymerase sigma-70 factor (ECF subfamily)